ncbi:MAG TPA: hypothetical protein V6D28_08800 [Leptolyngbyaceae cyanobacterium]
MTESPFANWGNSTLNFTLPGEATGETDPLTGNQVFGSERTLVVVAKLDQNGNPRIQRLPGVDPQAAFLYGRVISASLNGQNLGFNLPAGLRSNQRAAATWEELRGEFIILLSGQSSWGVHRILGDRINGWFEIK